MADNGQWFKLWIGADEDPDLGDFSLENFGRWCKFGLYLKKYGTGGTIKLKSPCLPLQHKFQVDTFDGVISVIKGFPNCDVTCVTDAIVTWKNWSKYQGDNSAERVRRFRQNVTPKKRGEERRREEKRLLEESLRKDSSSTEPENLSSAATPIWPANLSWIPEFLESQAWLNGKTVKLLNPPWWVALHTAVNGFDQAVLKEEFAKMEVWILTHPSRRPTPRGVARFVAGWLERTYERERRIKPK